jgi:hypothetical protein
MTVEIGVPWHIAIAVARYQSGNVVLEYSSTIILEYQWTSTIMVHVYHGTNVQYSSTYTCTILLQYPLPITGGWYTVYTCIDVHV